MTDTAKDAALRYRTNSSWLRVYFAGSGSNFADFHYRFLRHNARTDLHPKSGERTLCSSAISDDIAPNAISYDAAEDALKITWNDGSKEATYTQAWLRERAYGTNVDDAAVPPSRPEPFTIAGTDFTSLDDLARAALAKARNDGFVIVRATTQFGDAEAITELLADAFAETGLRVRSTHFGRIEDLRPDNTTNQNTDQLGYTDSPIDLHTDQPFLDDPPRYQLLQGVVQATRGGENALVDAYTAARAFAAESATDHQILSTTPVRFHRKQKAFESIVDAPILVQRGEGPANFQTRFSYFTLAPYTFPFAKMNDYYRAYDNFSRYVRDPKHQVQFALGAGDFVLYDNHRMLHARLPFEGPRWVRGVYFDEVS